MSSSSRELGKVYLKAVEVAAGVEAEDDLGCGFDPAANLACLCWRNGDGADVHGRSAGGHGELELELELCVDGEVAG
eukprot:226205-Rhodomonas_salina.1